MIQTGLQHKIYFVFSKKVLECVWLLFQSRFCLLYSGIVYCHGRGQRPITGRIHFGHVCPSNKQAGEWFDCPVLQTVVCLFIVLFRKTYEKL